jgi:ABC-type nickel/cobalt efflux system permease component RcnA
MLSRTLQLAAVLLVAMFGLWSPAADAQSQYVRCESHKHRDNYCSTGPVDDVIFVRQIGRSSCHEGISFGFDGNGIWVTNGCRADFEVRRYGGRGYGHGYGHQDRYERRHHGHGHHQYGHGRNRGLNPNRDYGYSRNHGYGQQQFLSCSSHDGRLARCGGYGRSVVLLRQHSRNQCVHGHSYGIDHQGLWVAQGCRGEFVIR